MLISEARANPLNNNIELLVELPREALVKVELSVIDTVVMAIAQEFLDTHKKQILEGIDIEDVKERTKEKMSNRITEALVAYFNENKLEAPEDEAKILQELENRPKK